MKKYAMAMVAVLAIAGIAQATVILQENFDGYADQAAMNAVWTPAVGGGAQLSSAQSYSPSQSAYIDLTARRSDRSIPETGAPSDAEPIIVSVRFRDSAVGNARQYIQFLDISPALAQLISLGVYNSTGGSVADNNTYYAARLAFGPNAGWFLLNDPGVATRSAGWHELKFVMKDTSIEFYVDGTLGKVKQHSVAAGTNSFDQIRIGSGLSTANGDAYYDDILIEKVPEPATLLLLGLGGLFLRRRTA